MLQNKTKKSTIQYRDRNKIPETSIPLHYKIDALICDVIAKQKDKLYNSQLNKFCRFLEKYLQSDMSISLEKGIYYLLTRRSGYACADLLESYKKFLLHQKNIKTGEKLNPRTVNKYLSSISTFLIEARRRGFIAWKTDVRPSYLKCSKKSSVVGHTIEEMRKVFSYLSDSSFISEFHASRMNAILMIAFRNTFRINEILNLDLSNYDKVNGILHGNIKGLEDKEKYPLADDVKQAIERWLKCRGKAYGPLFTRSSWSVKTRETTGTRSRFAYNNFKYSLLKLSKQVEIDLSTNRIRHCAITFLLSKLDRVSDVLEITRHQSEKTVMLYQDLNYSKQRQNLEIAGQILK